MYTIIKYLEIYNSHILIPLYFGNLENKQVFMCIYSLLHAFMHYTNYMNRKIADYKRA